VNKIEIILLVVFLQRRHERSRIKHGGGYQASYQDILEPDPRTADIQSEIEGVFPQDDQNRQYRESSIKKKSAEITVLDHVIAV
jgi:hypothetical protein